MEIIPEQDTLEQLKARLQSKRWRLTSGKFYKIKDKTGRIVPFEPNVFQLYYLKNKHFRNLILKARQMGFSTIIQLDYLDDALFNKNFSVGIVAQDKETASLIRKDKIEVALDNLPDWCAGYRTYDKSNSKEITFSNGSSIYVSNSFRGGTLQRLHISEYGKICAKYPNKAKEIRTGAVEAVALGMEVTIESTAEGNDGDFYQKCEDYKLLVGSVLTPLDYKFMFFPRWIDESYSYEGVVVTIPQDIEDYFTKLKNEFGIELTDGQKNWYYLKRKDLKEDMKREYPSTSDEAFEVAVEGSYYSSQINAAYQGNRVVGVGYDSNLPVYTCWDLGGAGGGDDCAVRWFQIFGPEIRWIDYWEGSGYSMTYIWENIVKPKPYDYIKHIGPHDLRAHSQVTGVSRLEAMKKLGLEFEIVESPAGAVKTRIEMVRDLFSNFYFDKKKTTPGLNRLKNYKRKWNDSTGQWMNEAAKNGAQHSADAIGYGSQYIRENLMPKIDEFKKQEEHTQTLAERMKKVVSR